jgi:hypothetical protein
MNIPWGFGVFKYGFEVVCTEPATDKDKIIYELPALIAWEMYRSIESVKEGWYDFRS